MKEETGKAAGNAAAKDSDSPIVFYYYFDLSDTDAFCAMLKDRFRKSGHDREIEFRSWNCYNDAPGRDGDIYCYDAVVLSTLVDDGYIRRLPDIIDTGRVFPWILDRSRIRGKIYGIPFMACAYVLICRAEDYLPVRSISDLPDRVAAPLKSMLYYYYLCAVCGFQGRRDEIMKAFRRLKEAIGEDAYAASRFSVYDGISRFNSGECRYLIGFSEDIRRLDPGAYKVQLLNWSDQPVNEMPMFPTDFISMGQNVSGEKLLDCLDLMEIISDSGFVYDLCTANGKLQYMLPCDATVYPRLACIDPLYHDLYEIMRNEDNGVFRYGKHFYPNFLRKEAELLDLFEQT